MAIFKDPITDDGMKKSAKGLLRINKVDGEFVLQQECSRKEEEGGELETVFLNGKHVKEDSLSNIRARLAGE